jgi:hypothetical protein
MMTMLGGGDRPECKPTATTPRGPWASVRRGHPPLPAPPRAHRIAHWRSCALTDSLERDTRSQCERLCRRRACEGCSRASALRSSPRPSPPPPFSVPPTRLCVSCVVCVVCRVSCVVCVSCACRVRVVCVCGKTHTSLNLFTARHLAKGSYAHAVDFLHERYGSRGEVRLAHVALAGAVAGFAQAFILCPVDVIKNRMQARLTTTITLDHVKRALIAASRVVCVSCCVSCVVSCRVVSCDCRWAGSGTAERRGRGTWRWRGRWSPPAAGGASTSAWCPPSGATCPGTAHPPPLLHSTHSRARSPFAGWSPGMRYSSHRTNSSSGRSLHSRSCGPRQAPRRAPTTTHTAPEASHPSPSSWPVPQLPPPPVRVSPFRQWYH